MMQLSSRPALLLLLAMIGIAGVVAGATVIARRMPQTSLTFQSKPDGPIMVSGDSEVMSRIHLPARLIGFIEGQTMVALRGDADAPRRSERGLTRDGLLAQDRARAAIVDGRVMLAIRDRSGEVSMVQRIVQPRRLGLGFWLATLSGVVGAAVGAWAVAVRPNAAAARAVAVAGVALLLAALPMAVLSNAELIVGGSWWHGLVVANWTAAQMYGAGLIACFLTFPAPLGTPARRRAAYWMLAATVPLVAVPTALLIANLDYITGFVSVDFLLIVAAVGVQWRHARRDPAARVALRLIGGVTVVTLAGFLLLYMPYIGGRGDPLLPDTASFVVVLPPFLAIAAAIWRGNFLGLSRWTRRLFAVSTVLLLLIGADAALVLGAGLTAGSAASIALLIAGAVWIVARQVVFERMIGSARSREDNLYGAAGTVVLAPTPAGQFERWAAALNTCFAPLEMSAVDADVRQAEVERGGVSLLVPAPSFGSALRLSAARSGTSLFRPRDAVVVDTFARLCARVEADRVSYDRGTREERRRIARDLHDDVSGRLLTSLHRRDVHEVRTDVRAALHELRTLVSDLEHGDRTVEEVVAAIRAEASERLAGAGIALKVVEGAVGAQPLDAAGGRAIESAAREAVTNVLRHASAAHVEIAFAVVDQQLQIDVTDNGRGVDVAGQITGNGLANMAVRMASVEGIAEVAKMPQGGTRACFRLPLVRREAAVHMNGER